MTDQIKVMERSYRMHAPIYDATRWAFLFGRCEIVRRAVSLSRPRRVLEVGCGTGGNLLAISRICPGANLTGLDASVSMLRHCRSRLERAGKEITLLHQLYQ